MINNKKILAIIPARGGSKGLPDKNIKLLLDKPLIAWTIEQAKNSKFIDEIHVSTDSTKIAKIAENYGIKVPDLRPDYLATDSSSTIDVVEYIIKKYEEQNKFFDYIVLLQATSPIRKKNDIDNAIQLCSSHPEYDGVISLGEVLGNHPAIFKKIINNRIQPYFNNYEKTSRRQDLEKIYHPYGFFYMIKTDIFKNQKNFYTDNILPYHIERWQIIDIDDEIDLLCCEAILRFKINEI
jgi:CMP-N-acetylneuraminic acid synthetase